MNHYSGVIKCRDKSLVFDGKHTKIMGILNVTPDSFSDGGLNNSVDSAVRAAVKMFEAGAEIIDIGGESTRPGYEPVSAEEEQERVCSVLGKIISETDAIISIDTTKPSVARAALNDGAHIINDVNGFNLDEMIQVVKEYDCCSIAMFNNRFYENPVTPITTRYEDFVKDRVAKINSNLILDPGIGFGTVPEEDIALIRHTNKIHEISSMPVLLALSRKRMIGAYMERTSTPLERDKGTIGANLAGIVHGADIIRVHDVEGASDSIRLWNKIMLEE